MRTTGCLVWIVFVALLATATAHAGSDEGWARVKPWSGYWWPMLDNGYNLYSNNGALQKYDQYVGNNSANGAQAWERKNRYTADKANSWWGYCHASAAAAISSWEDCWSSYPQPQCFSLRFMVIARFPFALPVDAAEQVGEGNRFG